VTDVPLEHDRRSGTAERLERIGDDISGLRTELVRFTAGQALVNAEFRDHIVKSAAIGDYHTETYAAVQRTQVDHAQRLRTVEDWRVSMLAYGTILKLTFGVSIFGVIIGIVSLVNMVVALGR
jgi:hypothetical protein